MWKKKNPRYNTLFCPQVAVQGNASSSDVVVISLNQPANTVEKKVPELEKWDRVQLMTDRFEMFSLWFLLFVSFSSQVFRCSSGLDCERRGGVERRSPRVQIAEGSCEDFGQLHHCRWREGRSLWRGHKVRVSFLIWSEKNMRKQPEVDRFILHLQSCSSFSELKSQTLKV